MRILVKAPWELPGFNKDPFSFDSLDRRSIAENLSWLLRQADEGLVISLNAPWGEGKTTFLELWKQSIGSDELLIPVYYNAFRYDFSQDSFVSMAATIHRSLEREFTRGKADRQRRQQLRYLKKAATAVAVDLAKASAALAVGSLSGGLLSGAGLREWAIAAFRRLTFSTLEVNADNQLEAYMRSDATAAEYQSAIRKLLEGPSTSKARKVVVLVDELDRCRPVFAVEVVERIKHLFRSDGVHFVLATHTNQLLNTLSSVYGVSEEDAQIYFQKFIDVEIRLPLLFDAHNTNILNARQYIYKVFHQLDLLEALPDLEADIDVVAALATAVKLSPRALNKVASYIALSLASCGPEEASRLRQAIVVAATIRVSGSEYYSNLQARGSFYERQGFIDTSLWNKLYEFFGDQAKKTAANVFEVTHVVEACRLLDMYEIPGTSDNIREAV